MEPLESPVMTSPVDEKAWEVTIAGCVSSLVEKNAMHSLHVI